MYMNAEQEVKIMYILLGCAEFITTARATTQLILNIDLGGVIVKVELLRLPSVIVGPRVCLVVVGRLRLLVTDLYCVEQ